MPSDARVALETARLKVLRAYKLRDELHNVVDDYLSSSPVKAVARRGGGLRVSIKRLPPFEVGLLLGELVYQCRSMLDQLHFALYSLNYARAPLPARWEETIDFPLLPRRPKHAAPDTCVPRSMIKHIDGLSDRAYLFVESVQPYYHDHLNIVLRQMREISGIDKHRRVNTTIVQVRSEDRLVSEDGMTASSTSTPLRDGTLISPGFNPLGERRIVVYEQRLLVDVAVDEDTVGSPQSLHISDFSQQIPSVMGHFVRQMGNLMRGP